MKKHFFRLQPFSPLPGDEQLVTGSISREDNTLHLLFTVNDPAAQLLVPERHPERLRLDGLWQTTCFEWFFRPLGSEGYHEVNLSPSGCWNLYHFTRYREGMREEPAQAEVCGRSWREGGRVMMESTLPLTSLVQPTDVLEVAVCCVLENRDGTKSYWALLHPRPQPDFHLPQGFILQL